MKKMPSNQDELYDWIDALENLILFNGKEDSKRIINEFINYAASKNLLNDHVTQIPFENSISNDLDLKKGDLHKKVKNKQRISYQEFLNISNENISQFQESQNLFCINKIKSLTDSFQVVNSPIFSEKIKEFKDMGFDLIIIDTAPLLSVADTGTLMALADINLMVIRHEMTKVTEVNQTLSIANQIGIPFEGIIYNYYKKPEGYYGYYGFYGNYDYQYYAQKYLYENYQYNDEQK